MRSRHAWLGSVAAAASLLFASPARAELTLGGSAGVAYAYGQTYAAVGARVGYIVALGLEPNVRGDYWFGNTPTIFKLSPGVNWYAPLPLHPYGGAFYSHWFVGSNLPDSDSAGARAGIRLLGAGPASVAVGVSYEHLLSCSRNCDIWSPEVVAGVSF